jgi:hypothetical protein
MIKRLHSRKSHGTLVANPRRRKKRNGVAKRRRRGTKLSAMVANGKGRKKRKNPSHKMSHYFARKGRRRTARRRNPDIAGVDLVSVGVGSVVAIAAGAIGEAITDKYLKDKIQTPSIRNAMPSVLVAVGAYAAAKYMQNPKVKQIAKVTMTLAVFKALDAAIGETIKGAVAGILPGGGSSSSSSAPQGNFIKPSSGYLPVTRGTSGAYVTRTGGAYAGVNGLLPGAGLYGL